MNAVLAMLLSVSGSESSECEKVCTIECQTDSTLIIHILSVSVLNGLCIVLATYVNFCNVFFYSEEEKKYEIKRTYELPEVECVTRDIRTTFTNEIQDTPGEKPSEKGLVFDTGKERNRNQVT